MNECQLQNIYDYPIYHRDSKIYSDKGYVKIDDGSQGGTHWTCFIVKGKKSYYFDTFGGQPDKFLINRLPNSIIFHNYEIQDINSKLCGSYCLFFFLFNWKNELLWYYFRNVFSIFLNMPINVFGNFSHDKKNKIDISLFVQKPYLWTNYIEANVEEDIDLKNQFRIKNIPDPISIREATTKNYVDNSFNDPSVLKNTAHIDLNDESITNARFIQVYQLPQIDSSFTAKLYVDNAIDEPSKIRNNQDNDFNNYSLSSINSITLKKQAENDNEVITKA